VTELMKESASMFQSQATRLKRKLWWQNVKLWLILITIILIILVIIVIAIVIAVEKNKKK
jgi:heme/copper-type cytochrome/quinol oxidase subunit 2